jgi:cytosine/adenosine deaminase-related metal-dependent hydrolase
MPREKGGQEVPSRQRAFLASLPALLLDLFELRGPFLILCAHGRNLGVDLFPGSRDESARLLLGPDLLEELPDGRLCRVKERLDQNSYATRREPRRFVQDQGAILAQGALDLDGVGAHINTPGVSHHCNAAEGTMAPWTLTARWVFPVAGPPLERGRVVVAGERIVGVEAAGGRVDLDLGNAAIVPGLVNAHVHLDLSGFQKPVQPGADFPAWLRAVIEHRRQTPPEQGETDIRAGLEESLRAGVTLLGDIAGGGLSASILRAAPVRSVCFRELLGLSVERADAAWTAAEGWLRDNPATATFRPGLSPHAPYSVRESLYRACVGSLPIATHLAESADEMRLLAQRDGPFVPFLQALGVYDPSGLVRDVPALLGMLAPVPRLLLVHGNYLDPDMPLPAGASVVYCPRTHALFGHSPHPYRRFRERGVRVALGTDGRSSNPDLSILEEARWLARRDPTLPREDLLRMITLDGAATLGWDDETGSLEPGKSADLVVVPLPAREGEPYGLLFDGQEPPARTLFRGAWQEPRLTS